MPSGVDPLDQLLGGLFIGDNVVWYDSAGSLASVFWMNFIQASQVQGKHLIYVSFDRSPKNLLEKLGPLAQTPGLIILDCFTCGKGERSDIFLKFYERPEKDFPCSIIRVEEPQKMEQVSEALYKAHQGLPEGVCFVFESMTGMQELWNGEDDLLKFYSRTCPRLYELNTIAYWVMEKEAHSAQLRAHINSIAQVAIELSVKRGKTSLSVLKAEKRRIETLNIPHLYWTRDLTVAFESEGRTAGRFDLGARIKTLRKRSGLSQTELARLIGVTPSNISQVESNMIYPSIPALVKIAEIISVDISAFFQEPDREMRSPVFPESRGLDLELSNLPRGSVGARRLFPLDMEEKAEPYLIELPSRKKITSHFFLYKGEEIGYLLSGTVQMKLDETVYDIQAGDTIYLTDQTPSQWKNTGKEAARFLWITLR